MNRCLTIQETAHQHTGMDYNWMNWKLAGLFVDQCKQQWGTQTINHGVVIRHQFGMDDDPGWPFTCPVILSCCLTPSCQCIITYRQHSRSSNGMCVVASHHKVLVQNDIWVPLVGDIHGMEKRKQSIIRIREYIGSIVVAASHTPLPSFYYLSSRSTIRPSIHLTTKQVQRNITVYLKLGFWFMISHSPRWIALFRCKILSVFEQYTLKLGLSMNIKQFLSKIHIGKDGSKCSTSFQSVFRAFLQLKKMKGKQIRNLTSEEKNFLSKYLNVCASVYVCIYIRVCIYQCVCLGNYLSVQQNVI